MNKIITILILMGSLASCTNHTEQDDLGRAQSCLDQVPQDNPTAASACMTYIQNYNDQQADILKCAILDTSGGLNEAKIVKGYNALKDSSQTSQAASFAAVLALDQPSPTQGYTIAQQGDVFCQATGVTGLQYISSLIVIGSALNVAISAIGGSVDISDPSSINTAVQNLLTNCAGATPNAACTSPAMGAAAASLATSYCSTASADQTVCSQVTGAVAAAGSDPTKVSQALICYLANKTYNASTGACQ